MPHRNVLHDEISLQFKVQVNLKTESHNFSLQKKIQMHALDLGPTGCSVQDS